jgi:hypothetical protein
MLSGSFHKMIYIHVSTLHVQVCTDVLATLNFSCLKNYFSDIKDILGLLRSGHGEFSFVSSRKAQRQGSLFLFLYLQSDPDI